MSNAQKKKPTKKKNTSAKKKTNTKKKTPRTEVEKGLPKMSENFSEWFNTVIFQADIIDYRYNLKGCGVWKGYGFKLRNNTFQIIRNLLDSTPVPHEEMLFPLLIPEDQFMREKETVKGFENEVYWVKDGGTKPLDVKLALRPTSETAMYPMVSKWIRSHQDLPLKTYQIVNTFRFEGKNTRPLIRVREITTFKEAHTYHATKEDVAEQIREAVQCYSQFFDALGVPYLITERPQWDTFPGADYSIAVDCMFPQKHRALQIGTIHNLGQTFGKTFDIKFETQDGKQAYVYQSCYGISERAIAAVIASHGDDNGLKLPPMIAPIQIVIVPILFKNKEDPVRQACEETYNVLRKAGLRVHYDTRDMSPGKKYFHWELKGVPIRVEIGPRDVQKGHVAIVRRDSREKAFIPKEEAVEYLNDLLSTIQEDMWAAAKTRHQGWVMRTDDLEEALDFVDTNHGIAEIPFCGTEECAATVEKRVDGLKFLGIPSEYLDVLHPDLHTESEEEPKKMFCAQCMTQVSQYWRIGRPY
jgi:prolyl-tRNA synthetase